MRIAVVSLLMLLLAPAAAQAKCPDRGLSARVVTVRHDDASRTSVVVCDHGHRLVPRRAVFELVRGGQDRAVKGRGTLIGGASAAGGRVAWIQTRFHAGRRVVTLVVARVGRRIHIARRTVVHRDRSRWPFVELGVQLTARGELAWLVPRRTDGYVDVILQLPGGRPRDLARKVSGPLGLEDGSTLRWGNGGYVFYDLPRPRPAGCPRRGGYRVVADGPEVSVTRRRYRSPGGREDFVTRACVLGSRRDRVLDQSGITDSEGAWPSATVVNGTTVALAVTVSSRYGACANGIAFRSYDARTGREMRSTAIGLCGDGDGYFEPIDEFAVTTDGVPAWLVRKQLESETRLLVAGLDHGYYQLDRGALTGLRAEGTGIVWSHGGEPRSADPH